jgi:hypothetical protein
MRYYLIAVTLFLFVACKKKEGTNEPPPAPPPVPPVVPVAAKKFSVDSTISKFISTQQDIANGDFKYDLLPGVDSLKKGDFFIEPRDYGYLRKIESVTKTSGQVIVSTTQAALSEFYQDSGLVKRSFSIPDSENPFAKMTSTNARAAASFPTVNISGQGWAMSLENLNFSFKPNWIFEYDVKKEYIKAGFEKAQTSFEYDLTITSDFTGTAETEFKLSSVFPVSKILKLRIPNLFLQVHVVDFIVKVKIAGGGKLEPKFHYKKQNQINAYLEYKNSALNGVYENIVPVYENTRTMSITGGLTATVEIYPIVRIREFGVPVINLGVKGIFETEVKHSLVYDTWDLKSQLYGGFFANFNKTAFQFVAPEEFIILSPKLVIVEAPKELKLVSGGNEAVSVNQLLKAPIILQVFEDNKLKTSEPEALVNVFYSSNYGKWGKDKIRTGVDGKASNTFTMGPEEKEHILTAKIKNAANEIIDSFVLKITPTKVDTLAILRSKQWNLANGPHKVYSTNTLYCPGINFLASELTSASLSFQLINGQTKATESRTGICGTRCYVSFDITNCIYFPSAKAASSSNTMNIVSISNRNFSVSSITPDQPGDIPWILYTAKIVSISETELVIQTLYWPGNNLVFR